MDQGNLPRFRPRVSPGLIISTVIIINLCVGAEVLARPHSHSWTLE